MKSLLPAAPVWQSSCGLSVARAAGDQLSPSPALPHSSGWQAGQPGPGTPRLGLCSSCAKSSSKERMDWVAGSRNTSHPFRLWKAVKPAGRSELISSIKTWLYLFQLPLQCIKAQPQPQGSSLLNQGASWGTGQLEKAGGSWQNSSSWSIYCLSTHLEEHSLISCTTCRLQEFQIPPGSLSNALKWHWSHRTKKLGSFPPIINFYFAAPALFRLDSSPLSFPLPPLILYQNGTN